jgi:hypothetical protein
MRIRSTTIRRASVAALIVGTVTVAGAAPAFAGHVHSMQLGNGSCVLLAQHGGEGEVELPFATDAQVDAHRAHPLHLLVHLAEPGTNLAIGVYGTASDPCIDSGDYVND